MRVLTAAGVPFELHPYEVDPRAPSYAAEAAAAIGVPAATVFKTLVAMVDGRGHLALVPADSQLDLKALAAAVGGSKTVMAEPADAERLTGYVVGGISPLGTRRPLPVVVDSSAVSLPRMHVSAGRRGLQVSLTPADLLATTSARVAPLAR